MNGFSEEQLVTHLLELENEGMADRRAELTGPRWLSLLNDESGSYVLLHAAGNTGGVALAPEVEVWQYATPSEAERAYGELIAEAATSGELVEEHSGESPNGF